MRIMVTQNENTVIVNVPDGSTIADVRKICQVLLDKDTPPELHLDVVGTPLIRAVGDLRDGDRLVARTVPQRKRTRYDLEDECDPEEDDTAQKHSIEMDECKDAGRLIRMAVRASYTIDLEGNEVHVPDQIDLPNAVKSLLNSASVPLLDLFTTFSYDVTFHFEDIMVPKITADHFHRVLDSHDLKLYVVGAPKIRHRMIGESTYTFQIARVPRDDDVDSDTNLIEYDRIELDMVPPHNELFQLYIMDFVHNCLEAELTDPRECHSYA